MPGHEVTIPPLHVPKRPNVTLQPCASSQGEAPAAACTSFGQAFDCRMNTGHSGVDKAIGMHWGRTWGFMEHLLVWPQQLQAKDAQSRSVLCSPEARVCAPGMVYVPCVPLLPVFPCSCDPIPSAAPAGKMGNALQGTQLCHPGSAGNVLALQVWFIVCPDSMLIPESLALSASARGQSWSWMHLGLPLLASTHSSGNRGHNPPAV